MYTHVHVPQYGATPKTGILRWVLSRRKTIRKEDRVNKVIRDNINWSGVCGSILALRFLVQFRCFKACSLNVIVTYLEAKDCSL